MKNNFLSIIAIIISIVAIGFSLLRIVPFEIGNDTFIGVIAAFIGISVTLLIGYQIYNVIETNQKIQGFYRKQNELLEKTEKISDQIDTNRALVSLYDHRTKAKLYSKTNKAQSIIEELEAIKISLSNNLETEIFDIEIFDYIEFFDEQNFSSVKRGNIDNRSVGIVDWEKFKSDVQKYKIEINSLFNKNRKYEKKLFGEIVKALIVRIDFLEKQYCKAYKSGSKKQNNSLEVQKYKKKFENYM